jgi:hypothetical protein
LLWLLMETFILEEKGIFNKKKSHLILSGNFCLSQIQYLAFFSYRN